MGDSSKTPFYYFRKRLKANKPAVFGLVIICVACLISLLGYSIMPDGTTNANNALPEIKKQSPGFEANILKVKKNVVVEKRGWIDEVFNGSESEFIEKPYDSLVFSSSYLTVYLASGRGVLYEKIDYADVIYSIKGDVSNTGTTTTFKDISNNALTCEITDLIEQIKNNHLIKRKYRLGTDSAGRDLLSRLLFGTRVSLLIGIVSVTLSLLIGVFLGGVAGYFGGWVDNVVMWFMTVVWSVPRIMLVIVIGMALQSNGIWVAFVAVGLTMWTEVARVVRGKVLEVREKQYIQAAKVLGLGHLRIIFGHILPNILGSVVVIATANFADAILIEAGLSFLGLGVPPPVPSWGQMVNEGFNLITKPSCYHLILFPSLAICLLVLSFNLLGNGLRDALDTKG